MSDNDSFKDEPAAPDPAPAPALEPPPPDDYDTIGSVYPRSLKRRIEQQTPPPEAPRVRSQPLNPPVKRPQRVREPVPLDWEPEPMRGPWRARPVVVALAMVAWALALALLPLAAQPTIAGLPARVLVPLAWALAAGLTFVPIQFRLGLPGIGWQGTLGWAMLGYLLAFVPAPTGWLLDLPDLPVYLLLFLAMFYAVTAAMTPLTYLLGQRFYKLRIHRLDVGRARRQAYEVGLLCVVVLVMAALRVLSPITFGLLALVIVLTEALLLSQVQPEG